MRRIFGLPKDDRARHARYLADRGFDSVVVGAAESADSVRPALDAGLRVWSCRAAFSVRDLSSDEAAPLLARDIDRTPQPWFGSGCPNQAALRDAHLRHIRTVAESRAFAGFMLDGIRFASPNAGAGFFTCFFDTCTAPAELHGIDLAAATTAARALRDRSTAVDGFAEWLRFRALCVAEHVREVRAAVDQINVSGIEFALGAYLFAPSLSSYVGQDYRTLAPLLDVVSPMLYRTLGPGDACLTTEYAALAACGVTPPHAEFTAEDVATEVRRARELIGPHASLVPILQLVDEKVAEVSAFSRSAGADSLDYFVYRPGSEPYVERVAPAASR
jgi:hypothetical protein